MSFFGEDDFSFLHNNYRDRSDDDDESDASSSDGEEDDEQSCTYVGVTPQSPVSVPDSPCDNQGGEGQEDSDGEPSRQIDDGEIEEGGGGILISSLTWNLPSLWKRRRVLVKKMYRRLRVKRVVKST
mmetsp:Transcript_31652/g.53967  ORF Transcript_31652/g.53967 Transcript_31652/m.53967 type:complete len:127 (+) Transcript_31652:332-712(+)